MGPLPLSSAGQKLAELFPNGWDWIYTETPKQGQKPNWETIKQYPLSPVELWSLHQDPSCIIGTRPGSTTRWGIIDLDADSKYHPNQNSDALAQIQAALEDIGVVRTLLCQSSHSGGLHLYVPLPEAISSFGLAVALKYNLEAAGIQLRGGQCEIFPNPKRYLPEGQGFSLYNGIRLPLQPGTGFVPLDGDLHPFPWSLEDWLEAFEQSAIAQDLKQLHRAIADAEHNHRIRSHRNPHSLASWSQRIEQEKLQGWTGSGQSNEKFKLFACEARVFMGMDSVDAIACHIQETATSTPGFDEYSHHTEDLSQRSREVATWAMRYYWPMGTPAQRETGYHSPQSSLADFNYHRAKREAAQHRIQAAVAQLEATEALPSTATARASAIVAIARVSQQTLYRESNKPLWHPEYIRQARSIEKQVELTPERAITQLPTQPQKSEHQNQLKRLVNKGITQLSRYVGFVSLTLILQAAAALTPQGQRAAQAALLQSDNSERGGTGGISSSSPICLPDEAESPTITSWTELRASLPPLFQHKLVREERERAREQEREQRRKQQAIARQQQLELGLDAGDSESSFPLVGQEKVLPRKATSEISPQGDCSVGRWTVESQGLPEYFPRASEQTEFEQWYELACRFRLTSDYCWQEGEHWVLSQGQWYPYAELSSTFTPRYLRQALQGKFSRTPGLLQSP